ncbi:MAG: MFS transporter [Actinomycetota bacterium]|nr:MFS transporter [Actinomycetota bacterium]
MPLRLLRPEGDTVRLFARSGYPSFALTIVLSRVGVFMFTVAGVLLVLERTHSATLTGVTAAAAVLPGALAGPVLGAWLEAARKPRRLMIADQLVSSISLLLLVALAGHAPDWTLPLTAVVYSITSPFSIGGFYSALAELAGPELMARASAFDATSLNVGVIVGPALAGALVGAFGAAVAVGVQAAIKLVVLVLIVVTPVFGARSGERLPNIRQALADGTRALARTPVLRAAVLGSGLSSAGWGLMVIGFPLYAIQILGSRAHDSGYLWAALGVGSILGTFALGAKPSLTLSAASYGVLGLSALLWLPARALVLGVALVTLSGVIEGPAFSGSIALRQQHAPPGLRAQVSTSAVGVIQIATSTATAVGGAIADPVILIYMFVGLNLLAGGLASFSSRSESAARASGGEGL